MELLKVARTPAITVTPEISVAQAIKIMAENKVGAVVVCNTNKQVLGIFTERDNLLRVSLAKRDMDRTRLAEVMTSPVDTAAPDLTIQNALARMVRNHYRHLPIVDLTGRILGIVSLRYLLMRLLSEKQATVEVLEAYVSAGGPG
jgi:CBS domain-containing protein